MNRQIAFGLCVGLGFLFAADGPTLDDAQAKLYSARFQEAADLYRQILSKEPALPAAHYGLVRSLLSAHQAQEAYAAADNALLVATNSAPAQTAAGLAAYRKGQIAEAEQYFRAALKIDAGYPGAMQSLASIYSAVSRFKSARDLLNAAYLRAPADPVLAIAHADSLQGAEHMAALEKILGLLDPDSQQARSLMSHIATDKASKGRSFRHLAS